MGSVAVQHARDRGPFRPRFRSPRTPFRIVSPRPSVLTVAMKLTIELDREVDGRWIAEVPELNVLLYGESRQDAIQRAQSAAREIVLDRIAHGELPSDSAKARRVFAALKRTGGVMTAPWIPRDHEKGRVGGLSVLVPRFRGTWSCHPCENLEKDGPSAPRPVIVTPSPSSALTPMESPFPWPSATPHPAVSQ
jgi:predicted RNase H-like HicB family nuclease